MDTRAGCAEPSRPRGERLCEAVVEASWLAAILLVPSFFNPFSGRIFEPDRAVLLELLVGLGGLAWLAKVAGGGRPWAPLPSSSRCAAHSLLVGSVVTAAVALALSASLALEPGTAWRGSGVRGFGAVTQLALLGFLGLLLGHLRDRAQRRRLLFAMVLGSLPVCLYGLLQAAGHDTVTWARSSLRVHSSLGNPVFLGAHLAVTGFATLAWVVGSRQPEGAERPARLGLAAAAGAYVVVLQLMVGLLTQSRGPLLGVAAGAATLLVLAVPRVGTVRRWLLLTSGLAAVALVVLVGANGHSRWFGRVSGIADLGVNSTRVRLLTWRGAERALAAGGRRADTAGRPDPRAALRPLVGFGPEMVQAAAGPFMPAELAQREPGRAADRAHNEVLEQLVTGGALGLAAWLALWLAGLELGLGALGTLRSTWRFRATAMTGAAAGVVVPVLVTGGWALSGPAAGAGLVGGVLLAVLAGRPGEAGGRVGRRRQLIVACLVAALVAHLVELQVGIAVVASRLAAFAVLGLLAAEATAERKGDATSRRPAMVPGLVAVAVTGLGAVAIHAMMRTPAPGATRAPSLGERLAGGDMPPLVALLSLTVLAAVFLGSDPDRPRPVTALAKEALVAAALLAGLAVIRADSLAGDVRLAAVGAPPERIIAHVAGHLVVLLGLAVATTAGLAFVLVRGEGPSGSVLRRPWAMVAAALAGLVLVAAALRPALTEIRADTALKSARALVAAGRPAPALRLARTARAAAPRRGWVALAAADVAAAAARTATGVVSDAAAAECREALASARALSPWTFAALPRVPECRDSEGRRDSS